MNICLAPNLFDPLHFVCRLKGNTFFFLAEVSLFSAGTGIHSRV
jgi:hypothetical protein